MTIEWNKVTWYSKLLAVVVFIATFFLGFWLGTMKVERVLVFIPNPTKNTHVLKPVATTTPRVTNTGTTPTTKILPYGKVTLRMGERATFKDSSVTLLDVMDESRCPEGVTCIWAGTVKAKILSMTGVGKSTEIIELGKSLTTEAETITFLSATPHPTQGKSILSADYRLIFEVTKRTQATPTQPAPKGATGGACFTGGCSGQICSDKEGVMSSCEFRESYACYQTATCERQASGSCGWTKSAKLDMCLSTAK